jgi:hypothetical protein
MCGSGSCGFTVIERPGTKVSGLFVFGDTVPMGWLAAKETFGLRFVDAQVRKSEPGAPVHLWMVTAGHPPATT